MTMAMEKKRERITETLYSQIVSPRWELFSEEEICYRYSLEVKTELWVKILQIYDISKTLNKTNNNLISFIDTTIYIQYF